MKTRGKEYLVKVITLMVGLTIAHLGVTLFLIANLGSDPFNVLIQGLFRGLQTLTHLSILTHGRVHMAICFLIIAVLLLVERSYVKIGTVLCMVCGGPIIDFFNSILTPILGNANMIGRLVMNVAGCVILAYGMTIVIKSDAGTGPNDLVAIVISDRLKKKFGIVRVIVDVCFALVGVVLGGTIGVGTVICAFVVGPVASFFLPINEKIIGKIYKKFM